MSIGVDYADCGGLRIPLWPSLTNRGVGAFEEIALQISDLNPESAEWDKIPLLAACGPYLGFVAELTGSARSQLVRHLRDFQEDSRFQREFSPRLSELALMAHAGDLRFHAITLYLCVRALEPDVFVETGVAQGKSSAMILLAMEHNSRGRLVSVDLPAQGVAKDGSDTQLNGREIGWAVPEYLRKRWDLRIGDSIGVLTGMLRNEMSPEAIDIFLHDSLHTYDHAEAELALVAPDDRPGASLVLVDNIDMGCGEAFNKFLLRRSVSGTAFRDFAGVLLRKKLHD